jgi:hypothetical protein
MTPDANAIASILGTVATGGLAAWAARSAKRTKPQERRDDFTEIKTALNERIDDLKEDIAGQQVQITGQQEQITGQGAAISWLVVDRRVSSARSATSGLVPPSPRPIPDRARPYLDHVEL